MYSIWCKLAFSSFYRLFFFLFSEQYGCALCKVVLFNRGLNPASCTSLYRSPSWRLSLLGVGSCPPSTHAIPGMFSKLLQELEQPTLLLKASKSSLDAVVCGHRAQRFVLLSLQSGNSQVPSPYAEICPKSYSSSDPNNTFCFCLVNERLSFFFFFPPPPFNSAAISSLRQI